LRKPPESTTCSPGSSASWKPISPPSAPPSPDCVARGDGPGAVRAAHTLKGACRQLGVPALGDLFAQVEHAAKAGDHAEAKRLFDGGAGVVTQSLDALKRA